MSHARRDLRATSPRCARVCVMTKMNYDSIVNRMNRIKVHQGVACWRSTLQLWAVFPAHNTEPSGTWRLITKPFVCSTPRTRQQGNSAAIASASPRVLSCIGLPWVGDCVCILICLSGCFLPFFSPKERTPHVASLLLSPQSLSRTEHDEHLLSSVLYFIATKCARGGELL